MLRKIYGQGAVCVYLGVGGMCMCIVNDGGKEEEVHL